MQISMMSSDLPEEIRNLQIPDDQTKRQAVDSLRGYIYQIYQTLNTWLTLKEDEILLLEVAEDFAVIAKDALRGTQVKDTAGSGSVTLKTKSVSKTIKCLWEFQQANPDRNVYITYLTTSKIGKERGLTFPDNHSGLAYWRVAAREGTDIEPIRQVLLALDLPPQVKSFIKKATPDELRDRILRQIKWVCDEKDIEGLEKTILDRLIYFGDERSFTPTDSEKARDSLITAILKKIVQKSDRQLSRADLLYIFESAVSISMPATQVRKLTRILAANQGSSVGTILAADSVLNATEIPLPPRVLNRRSLVEELVSNMGQSGAIWLHGSSGTGKTVLTQFIARRSKYNWLFLQLRDCSVSELDFRLCRVLQTSQSGRIGGVILDDLPTEHAHSARLRLSILSNEVHRMDGSVIVTSAKPPSPNVQGCFGEDGPNVIKVPYLNRDEVAELVKLANGDAKKWAGVVYSFCGFGHPQLVQARISGLRQRDWPNAELLAGIPGIGGSAKEIDDARDSIREQLLSELSPNTRDLLYRLTLLVGYFDRELAIAIGEVDPSIGSPGEALDILLGPWVEALAKDCFRVSPLVSSAGTKTLSKPVQMKIHQRIVDNLIARHPFPGDFLGTLLGHALVSRHVQGLTWLTMAIMHTPNKDRRMIAENLFVLPLLDTSQPLFKENIHLSTMLRFAQFRIAAWANKTDSLPTIANQLITETRMIDNKEIADGFLFFVITSILVEQSLRISPPKWIPLLEELKKAMSGEGKLAQFVRTQEPFRKGLGNWTTPQFIFYIRATSLKSINELVELFSELNHMEHENREMLLSSLSMQPSGKQLLIDSAWLADTTEKTLDGIEAAGKFRQLAKIAEMWGNKDIAVECECARAVMLDEYADDTKGALVSLEQAEKKYPKNVRLLRERAKVYYHDGDHTTALVTIEKVADAIPKDDHIERAFALREAGVSAAKIGNFTKASNFFCKACEAASASTDNMRTMAIGLKGDQALAQFQLGEKGKALNLMHQAIIDAEQLNPETGINEKYCILILGNALLWMQEQVKPNLSSKKDFQIAAGSCSNPAPPEEIMERTSPPFMLLWYQLALLEVMMGINSGIIDELRKRTHTQKILSCELVINPFVMTKYVITSDIENFFLYLPEYVSKIAYMKENASSVNKGNIHDLTNADLPAIKPVDWTSTLHLQYAKDAILAIAATAVCSNTNDIKEQLLSHAEQNQDIAIAFRDFIDSFEKKICPKGDVFNVVAFYLGCLMNVETISPDKMFLLVYRIWEWLLYTEFKDIVENMIADYLARHWQKIIEHQRFNLQQPMIAVPDIEAAIDESAGGTVKIAKLLLAAEIAVKHKLGANLRSKLEEHCLQNQKGDV
ncbi:tetratricopeptide repeat protein [Planctomycetota bacterium]